MLEVQEHPVVEADAEALFKEARRRERRRHATIAATGLAGAGVLATIVILLTAGGAGRKASSVPARPSALSGSAATVALKQPMALALSRVGVLYVLDPSRDQILRRLRNGRFAAVAGSGHQGFSGDGGPATRAALRLDSNSALAVSRDGTLYFTDTGNNRVRAVLPDGKIETVAGDGHRIPRDVNAPYLTGTRPALHTELVDLAGLAFGPGGKLYISAQDVVALLPGGKLTYFAGATGPGVSKTTPLWEGPGGIAFDRAGDMFVSSFPWLTERTAAGRILFLGDGFRSNGAAGILASSANGTVYEAYGDFDGIINRLINPRPVPTGRIMSSRGVQSVVSPDLLHRVVGTRGKSTYQNGFGPQGLAISANGTIYADTDSGYFSSVSALVEITHSGRVRTLWTSR